MRRRINTIFDLLERIHVAGREVDIMATVRQEMRYLARDARLLELGAVGSGHPDPVGPPGEPGEAGKENENG